MVFFIHPAPLFTLDLLLEANSVGTEQISWANKAIQINTPGNVPFSHSSAPTWGSLCQHFASKIIGAGYEHHPVVIQMREGELGGGGGISCSLVKDHHLHSLAQTQELSQIVPWDAAGWWGQSHPSHKPFCSDSSYHDGAFQSDPTATLKGRGVGDVSLLCIYSDTRAGLWSLQRREHDDSKERMRPGEKGGSQTDGGSPQTQNLATLSKKYITTWVKSCLPPHLITTHIPNTQGAIVFQPLIYSS